MKKKLLFLVGTMLLISVVGAFLINLVNVSEIEGNQQNRKSIKVVTTFYPIYMIGLNLTDGIDNIEVKSLTDLQTGCLHDYQLTTEDMKIISEADILVINGGGMESFLEDIESNYPELTVLDASSGITMLNSGSETEHIEEENNTDNEKEAEASEDSNSVYEAETSDTDSANEAEDKDEAEVSKVTDNTEEAEDKDNTTVLEYAELKEAGSEEHDHEGLNAHVWLDPQLYIKQIENVRAGILIYIKENNGKVEEKYKQELVNQVDSNAQEYIQSIMEIDSEIEENIVSLVSSSDNILGAKQVVIFHDSFAYLANRVGMKVAYTVPLDSDTSLNAGDIAAVIDVVNQNNIKLLFTEEQYSDSIAKQIEEETQSKVQIIDTVVTGDGTKDSYIKAMRRNLLVLQKALKN